MACCLCLCEFAGVRIRESALLPGNPVHSAIGHPRSAGWGDFMFAGWASHSKESVGWIDAGVGNSCCRLSQNVCLLEFCKMQTAVQLIYVKEKSCRKILQNKSIQSSLEEDLACSAVVIVLRFGTQGPGFEPGLFHKACYMPLHGFWMKLRV